MGSGRSLDRVLRRTTILTLAGPLALLAGLAAGPASTRSKPAFSPAGSTRPARPPVRSDPIPYPARRRHEMAHYSRRHYGAARWRLRHPHVIVLHFTGGSSYQSTWNAFASNASERGELPGVCAHFVIEKSGTIHQLVPTTTRCRHAIGLNYTAVGIEMVQETGSGSHWADQQILQRRPQVRAALKLVRFLRAKYGIKIRNVIGHAMANNSPYFKDDEGWTNDHTDWLYRDVKEFRRRLRAMS
jgi:N-acetyl-anhydromuramyl-L-alanine amidase AmpD